MVSMMSRYGFLILFILIGTWSCRTEKSDEKQEGISEELSDEMDNRKLKRVKEGEILGLASELGAEIAEKSQRVLGGNLKKAMSENGAAYAVEFCNANAYSILDSLRDRYKVEIKRASLKVRNPDDDPTDLERQILEAYQYNIESGIELQDNIQRVGTDQLLFSRPIVIKDGICLSCHGNPGSEINPATQERIKELYPADNATGHEFGQLRGMWSITFDKGELVKML